MSAKNLAQIFFIIGNKATKEIEGDHFSFRQ